MPPVRFDQRRTREHISLAWGVGLEDLDFIDTTPNLSPRYREMRIPKRGKANQGKYRVVYKTEWGVLHQLQKNLARDISDSVTFPECVQGFVRGRSIVSNARLHLGQPVVFHADIEGFFDAIGSERVAGAFVSLGCDPSIAALLTKVCTLNGRLPQVQAPVRSSPISSVVHSTLTSIANGFAPLLWLRRLR